MKSQANFKETRGSGGKSPEATRIRDSVRKFIKLIPTHRTHYGSQKRSKRRYIGQEAVGCLDAPKTIRDVWLRYTFDQNWLDESEQAHCTERFFHDIFVSDFNISFQPMKIDSCELCMRYAAAGLTETDAYKRHRFTHKEGLKKTASFKNTPETDTFSFCGDLCSVVDSPKLPGATFYVHQLSNYIFGCVRLSDGSV
jgi:hypothetical protein